MLSSLKLGKLFGIDLYVHGTFWLLPLFILLTGFGSSVAVLAFELALVFAVFACVALHEVGHALAAAAYGIRTRDITLYPVGGVASLEGMPDKPGREIAVALAGPAVNVVIAIGLVLGLFASGMTLPWAWTTDWVEIFVHNLFFANVLLFAFNLLPAFPMDGGRVLRALLRIRMTRLRATEVAVKVGTAMAILFLVAGIVFAKFSLIAVAVIVWLLGQAELASIRFDEARQEFDRRSRAWFGDSEYEPRQPQDVVTDLAKRRYTGLVWNATRAAWVQWVNGVPVRELPR